MLDRSPVVDDGQDHDRQQSIHRARSCGGPTRRRWYYTWCDAGANYPKTGLVELADTPGRSRRSLPCAWGSSVAGDLASMVDTDPGRSRTWNVSQRGSTKK